jgi:hypothetical protein
MTNERLPSVYSVLSYDVQQLRADLRGLIGQSRLKRRFEDAGGGLVMITPTPYRWRPPRRGGAVCKPCLARTPWRFYVQKHL